MILKKLKITILPLIRKRKYNPTSLYYIFFFFFLNYKISVIFLITWQSLSDSIIHIGAFCILYMHFFLRIGYLKGLTLCMMKVKDHTQNLSRVQGPIYICLFLLFLPKKILIFYFFLFYKRKLCLTIYYTHNNLIIFYIFIIN